MPDPNECVPCKIIIDGRVLAGAARYFGLQTASAAVAAASRLLADTADAATEALMFAVRSNSLSPEALDEAHAMSELSCHRAAYLRSSGAVPMPVTRQASGERDWIARLNAWAEELRLHTTKLIGGEYKGAWTVDGVTGIKRKP